ncbi:NB-ARC domain-containing protein [Kitasatospora sp. NPDC058218]|uniref:NB-ARC domain-containing protein n=1 Tax=Kitasatospora sp. NPDC058218 TaxID=3346385 RepID=UPI0036D7CE06
MPDATRNQMAGGTVNGMLVQAHQVNVTTEEPRWPHQVGVVPAVADAFQSRGLVTAITGSRAVVLSGMGGTGKTQLAAHHAHTQLRAGHVDLLVWATATSRPAVRQAYAQAAVQLGLSETGDAERFLAWLNTTDRRWLVVLDDLQDPADLRGLWPPITGRGRTVATTRRRDPALRTADRGVIHVELFSPEESSAYLAARLDLHGLTGPDVELAGLAADLGHLPLALAQAAAYLVDLADTGLTVAAYRARLRERRPLAELGPDRGALPDDQQATLAAVLALLLERADAATAGLATPVLQLASVFAPDGVPVSVLTAEGACDYLADTGRTVTAATVAGALRTVHRLGLGERVPPGPEQSPDLFRVHVLTQRAAHDSVEGEEARAELFAGAVEALLDSWPTAGIHQAATLSFVVNAAALRSHGHEALWQENGRLVLMVEAFGLGYVAQPGAAAARFESLGVEAAARCGPDHAFTLDVRQQHALFRSAAGDVDVAVRVLEELLADRVRLLGPDHVDTRTTRWRLAQLRADRAQEFELAHDLLAEQVRVYGVDHPNVVDTRLEIAMRTGLTGDPAGALAALAELTAGGPEDDTQVLLRAFMACMVAVAEDPEVVHDTLVALVDDVARVVGPGSSYEFLVRGLLADNLRRVGRPEDAQEVGGRLLSDLDRTLGPDDQVTRLLHGLLGPFRGETVPRSE